MSADLPTRASLLKRLRDPGDEEAWTEFVRFYTPLIYGFCRGRGLGEADAADVTQEVLRSASQALGRFEYDPERSSFRHWLFTVIRSKLANFFAAQAARPRLAGETTLAEYGESAAEGAAEEVWAREHQTHLLRWAAGQIRAEFKPETWDAFWRTAVSGDSVDAVAADLNLSPNAVYIARSRVTQRLKDTIERLGERLEAVEGGQHG